MMSTNRIEFYDKIKTSSGTVYRYKHYFSGKMEMIEVKSPLSGIKMESKPKQRQGAETASPVDALVMRKVEARSRPTIMSGEVWDYSDKFEVVDGIFGDRNNAVGSFHLSASRDEVIVHYANLKTDEDFKLFGKAMVMAQSKLNALTRRLYA